MKIAVVYASKYGSTAEAARWIAQRLELDGLYDGLEVGRWLSIKTLPAVPAKPRADWPLSKTKPGRREIMS